MADFSKISPDDGSTILYCKDSKAVRWTEAQGYVGKNLLIPYPNSAQFGNESTGLYIDFGTRNNSLLYIGKIEHNQTYRVTRMQGKGNRFRVTLYENMPSSTPSLEAETIYNSDNAYDYTFTNTTYNYAVIIVCYEDATNHDDSVIKGMLRLASISDDTYEPYAMTNRELTNKFIAEVSNLKIHSDYIDSFNASSAQAKLVKMGNIAEIFVGDLKCIQAITLTSWKQMFYDLPKPANGSYISGIFLTVGRETMKPLQYDWRTSNPTGSNTWGISPASNITLNVNDSIHFHLIYMID